MPTPFPGMDPYLERTGMWRQVHTGLIVDIQKFLTPLLRPKYQAAVEQQTYLSLSDTEQLAGVPDVLAVAPSTTQPDERVLAGQIAENAGTYVVDMPMPDEIVERYLEIRDVLTGEAITEIEILSPSNKLSDREKYERKRLRILGSMTNLVEIDLLRIGNPMAVKGDIPQSHYRIIVSHFDNRPQAKIHLFGVRDPIPNISIPLRVGDEEPLLLLNDILHTLYDQAGYDSFIDYSEQPVPPLSGKDYEWAKQLVAAESI